MSKTITAVTMKGNPVTLVGKDIDIGQPAPDFTAVANDLSTFKFSSLQGKKIIISAVPSLDTPICDKETKRFNQESASLGKDVVILTISMDLPFAQKRWCAASVVKNVLIVSDHRDAAFGEAYGVLIQGARLLARAIFVVDTEGIVRYKQVVPEIAQEPNYDDVLEAVKKIASR